MKKNKLFLTGLCWVTLLIGCQKNDKPEARPQGPQAPAPVAAGPSNPNQPQQPSAPNQPQNPDLVQKDFQQRQVYRQQMLTTNPGLSKTPIVKSPRLDDLVAVGLQIQKQEHNIERGQFVVLLRQGLGHTQMSALKFSLVKFLNPKGQYESMALVNSQSKAFAEARCLKDCEHVLVRFRRLTGAETAFVFKVDANSPTGLLISVPGLDQDPRQAQFLNKSRIVELSFSMAQKLESGLEQVQLNEKGLSKALESQRQVLKDLAAQFQLALNEIYSFTHEVLKNNLAAKVNLNSSLDSALIKISQNIVALKAELENQLATNKIPSEAQDKVRQIETNLQTVADQIQKTRNQLPLLGDLVRTAG